MMAEAIGPLEATAARCVAIRELARSAGSLINEVESEGSVFAVSRRGRIVALLVPLPDRLVLEFENERPGRNWQVSEPIDDADAPEGVELSALQEEFLIDAASTPTGFWHIPESSDVHAAIRAAGRLELAGLFDRPRGTLRLTRAGRALAKRLIRERGG